MLQPLEQLTTEQENPNTREIDFCPTLEKLTMMNREDAQVAEAVGQCLPAIAATVDRVYERLRRGGRLFYVGAGTSGRIGVLDASECPPTFSTPPSMVQAIIAGGEKAVFTASEGVEDDRGAGRKEMARREVGRADSVVGIAASGRTPFVVAALQEAKSRGALTVGLCNTEGSSFEDICDVVISVVVGAEVLTGSTRLKAGTAQKMVLNMISTCVMIKLGKVYQNFMVDLKISNGKLKDRAVRIVRRLTGAGSAEAENALERCDGNVKQAVVVLKTNRDPWEAERLLEANGGFLRKALESVDGGASTSQKPDGAD